MKKCLFTITALIALVAFANAQSIHYYAADEAPALRIYNGDADETLTVTISSGGAAADMTAVIGSTTNTIDGSGNDDTVAELAALFAACTNSSGSAALTVDTDCVVATTESTDGELLDGTYTATAGNWVDIPWDTSDVVHYDVYVPDSAAGGLRTPKLTLKNIYGSVTGTGAVTLSVYLDGTLVWQKNMPEVYESTNNTATVALPVVPDIPVGDKAVLIRAVRATTATTGMLGATFE